MQYANALHRKIQAHSYTTTTRNRHHIYLDCYFGCVQ